MWLLLYNLRLLMCITIILIYFLWAYVSSKKYYAAENFHYWKVNVKEDLSFSFYSPFSLTVHAWLASHYGEIYGEILVLLLTEDPAACRHASAVYSPCRKVLRGALPLCVQWWKRDRARQLLAAPVLQSALWVCRVAWVEAVRNNDSVTLCFPFDK